MRRVWVRSLTAVTAAAVVATGLVLSSPGTAAAATTPTQLYGAQIHTMWESSTSAQVDAQLNLLQQLGSDTARVDVAWASLQEAGRGQISSWYANRLAYLITASAARGIRPIIVLLDTPCWASSAPSSVKQDCSGAYWERGTQFYAPTDPADFAWIAAWIATRYGDRLAAIELWNEPNYDDGSYANLRAPNKAVAYTAMVEAAYPAIKAVAPGLPVLAGSLSYSDTTFLNQLFAAGLRSFDGISVHPYNEGRAPGSAYDPAWIKADFVNGMPALWNNMVAKGFSNRSVWITEMGWATCAAGSSSWCVTEAQQASYLAAAVNYAAAWPWLRSFVAYTLRNGGSDATNREHNFGLTSRDLTPKPAFAALRAAFTAARVAATTASEPAPTAAPTDSTPVVETTTTTLSGGKRPKARPRDITNTARRQMSVRIGHALKLRIPSPHSPLRTRSLAV